MNKTILIIEDELKIRFLLRDYLKSEGFNVLEASDGDEGIFVFKNNKIDLILLDIMMPKIDGITVLETIRTVSDLPIILLTAKTDAEDAEEETAVTNNGTEINLNDYKAMFAMADMLVDDSKALQIKETGEFKLTMTIDALKDMNAEDLLFVTTNPDDGTVSFIEPDEFDAETGTITGTFNHVGPFTIATKGEFEVQPQVTVRSTDFLC